MRLRVFLLTVVTGVGVYGLLAYALETIWAVCVAAWLSSAVAFYGIAFAEQTNANSDGGKS